MQLQSCTALNYQSCDAACSTHLVTDDGVLSTWDGDALGLATSGHNNVLHLRRGGARHANISVSVSGQQRSNNQLDVVAGPAVHRSGVLPLLQPCAAQTERVQPPPPPSWAAHPDLLVGAIDLHLMLAHYLGPPLDQLSAGPAHAPHTTAWHRTASWLAQTVRRSCHCARSTCPCLSQASKMGWTPPL